MFSERDSLLDMDATGWSLDSREKTPLLILEVQGYSLYYSGFNLSNPIEGIDLLT
jgi:hypothetical protein